LLKRVRRRYLALEIDVGEMVSSKEFMDAVWNAVLKLYGEYGASRTGLTLINYNNKGSLQESQEVVPESLEKLPKLYLIVVNITLMSFKMVVDKHEIFAEDESG